MIPTSLAKFGLLAFGTLSLAACTATGPSNLRVHEATIYGAGAQRVVWVYGDLGGNASSSLRLGPDTVTLRGGTDGPAGSLSVNGRGAYTAPVAPLSTPSFSLTRQGGAFTVGGRQVRAVYYTDGRQWQQLSSVSGAATGRTVTGLRGAGNLTDAEADALSAALAGQGALAVAVLDESAAPDAAVSVEPKPSELRRTVLYVMSASQITTVTAPVPAQPTPVQTTPTPRPTPAPSGGQNVAATELASGTSAAAEEAGVVVARSAAEVRNLYRIAYGRQSGTPTVPSLASGEALVGVFIGPRSTGGYGVGLGSAAVSGGTLNLRVNLRAPKPGDITTQALTSPWVIVRVGGAFTSVNVTDQTGRVFPY